MDGFENELIAFSWFVKVKDMNTLLMPLVIFILAISFSWASFATCQVSGIASEIEEKACGQFDASQDLIIVSDILKSAAYNKNGLAEMRLGEKCFWFTRKGKYFRTPCVDGKPDAFSARLARYITKDEKYGYMNWSVLPVISAKWDYALRFQTTFAKVCNNCRVKPGLGPEESRVEGGPWYMVNLKGRVVKTCPEARSASECQF